MIVEVESNENCQDSVFARFKEVSPARQILYVRLYDRNPLGEWYWVTGWSDDQQTPVCPAYAQLVEDSGAGLAHLVYGGVYGLRFKPINVEEARSSGEKGISPWPAIVTCAMPTSSRSRALPHRSKCRLQ